MNDTVDRMGRQLRGVMKLLSQQAATPTPAPTPAAASDDPRIAELRETVERMSRELRGVLNLLIQQQAVLAHLSEAASRTSPPGVPAHVAAPSPSQPTGIGGVQRRPRYDDEKSRSEPRLQPYDESGPGSSAPRP